METLLIGAQIGLLYGPLGLGIYLAISVLSLPDLTLEGSFGVGAATGAATAVAGFDPVTAMLAGMAVGACAGLITAVLHTRLRMNVLLTGILMTSAAWSVSIAIMGTGNVSLVRIDTLFTWVRGFGVSQQNATIIVAGGVSLLLAGLLAAYLHTSSGLAMRATGLNIQTARSFGIRTERYQIAGLAMANALAAASGVLVAHSQGFMDVSIQGGIIVVGLAALIVGMTILPSEKIIPGIIAVLVGVVVYRIVIAFCLRAGIPPANLKLLTTLIVLAFIAIRMHGGGLYRIREWRQRRRQHIQFLEENRVVKLI
ncbi:MAG: hypothetical protein JJT95_16300 [Pararhodobacter sp.]|nr:hypothetical protein [Pararhodobacter sp.]